MMIGTNYNMITDANGYTVPETEKFHAKGCTVHFGDWNDYYYCELVANSLASYTHDHQFSRLQIIESLSEIKDGENWLKTGNFLLIEGETKTCYHIIKDAEGNLKRHNHEDAGYDVGIDEDKDGKDDLKEDKQIVYLPFNQLFTGYGWGVKHIPVYNGKDYAFKDITILDRDPISYDKFELAENVETVFAPGDVITIGELFVALKDAKIVKDNVMVFVSPTDNKSTVSGVYNADKEDWTQGMLFLAGEGSAIIAITDYNYCKITLLEVTVGAITQGPTIMDGDHVYVPFD